MRITSGSTSHAESLMRRPLYQAKLLRPVKTTLRNLAIFTILSGAASISRAQDAAPSTVDLQSPRDQPAVPAATPSNPPDLPELSKLDEAFKQTSLGKDADEFRRRVELRRLQNEAWSDPAVIAAKSSTEAARTDLEKRQRLRDYYNLFYDRMRTRASGEEMRSVLDSEKSGHLKMLDQPRVRHATDGASPTPSPERRHETNGALPTPSPDGTPSPAGKHKKKKKQKKSKYFSRRLLEDHFESLRSAAFSRAIVQRSENICWG